MRKSSFHCTNSRHRRLRVALFVLLTFTSLLATPAGSALAQQNRDEIEQTIEENKQQVEERRKVVEDSERHAAEVTNALEDTNQIVSQFERELAEVTRERELAAAQVAETVTQSEQLEAPVQQRAAALYMSGGLGEVTAIANINDVQSLMQRSEFIGLIAEQDTSDLVDLEQARSVAESAVQRLENAERDLTARTDQLRETQGLQQEAKQVADTKVQEEQSFVDELNAESASLQSRLDGRVVPGVRPTLARPVDCAQTSGFGYRWGRIHEGLDFGCPSGTPVRTAATGTVIEAGWSGAYGNLILVDHGSGYVTAYAHNSSLVAGVGQEVGQGETIARSGNTGRSTGPHLHWEVRVGGAAQNPAGYLA